MPKIKWVADRLVVLLLISLVFTVRENPEVAGQPPPPQSTPGLIYRNPVIPGDFPDPTIIRVGDTYYAAGTSSEWAPYYPLYESRDLVNWDQIGHIFEKQPSWAKSSFWAPELFYHNATFYVYYTAKRKSDGVSCIGVATTKDIRRGFQDHGIIVEWGREAIDGFVFRDADGVLYISWKAYGLDPPRPVTLMASELSADGLRLKGRPFELIRADKTSWDRGGMEGQAIVKKGPYYYLFYSGRGCCGRQCDYMVGVARAKSVRGRWEQFKANPLLKGGGDWKCPGHGTVAADENGRYFYLYHAYHSRDSVYLGRQGLLDEILWSGDGWPYFRFGDIPTSQSPSPFGAESKEVTNTYDEFDGARLAHQWQWDLLRPPRIILGGGRLTISQGSAEGDSGETVLGILPESGDYTVTTAVTKRGRAVKGLTAYGDRGNLLGFGISDDKLTLWKVEKNTSQVLRELAAPLSGEIVLRMTVRGGYIYRFYWSADGKNWHAVDADEEGTTEGIDGSYLPPWDRAARAGLIVKGGAAEEGIFAYFKLDHLNSAEAQGGGLVK